MLKKRLVGVVTVKDGLAIQSFGYRRYLPLGSPECIVENLDRWGVDEILVQVIDRSNKYLPHPDFNLIDRLARLGLTTPLIYGGGIRSVEDGVEVIQRGADRVSLNAVLFDEPTILHSLSLRLGSQALIASMPVSIIEKKIFLYDYRSRALIGLTNNFIEKYILGNASEIMITDWNHEGSPESFDEMLIDLFPDNDLSLIAFGGISKASQIDSIFNRSNVVAVAVGNFLNYREHAIHQIKEKLTASLTRPPTYSVG